MPSNDLSFMRMYQGGQRMIMVEGYNVKVNAVHLILKNYLTVDTDVETMKPCFDTMEAQQNHAVSFTVSLCSDNSAFI